MPRFEEPIDSAKQLNEKNMTLLMDPGSFFWVQFLSNSPIPEYQTLSKRTIVAKDYADYFDLIEQGIIGNGTHAYISYGLRESPGKWWQGNMVLGNYPYGGYLSDKKWHLNEAFDIFFS